MKYKKDDIIQFDSKYGRVEDGNMAVVLGTSSGRSAYKLKILSGNCSGGFGWADIKNIDESTHLLKGDD